MVTEKGLLRHDTGMARKNGALGEYNIEYIMLCIWHRIVTGNGNKFTKIFYKLMYKFNC